MDGTETSLRDTCRLAPGGPFWGACVCAAGRAGGQLAPTHWALVLVKGPGKRGFVCARACVHASVCGYACTRVCKRACAARAVLWLGSGLELRGVSSRFCWSPDCWSPEPPGATCLGWAHGSRTVPGGALRWVSKLIPRGAPGSRLHPHVAGCLLCATRRLGGAGRCPHGLALGWGGRREGNATVDLAQGGPLEGTAPGQA